MESAGSEEDRSHAVERPTASPEPLRVLLACDHIGHGGGLHGGGRQLIELTRALQERPDVDVRVLVLRGASELGRSLQADGLPMTFFGDHRFNPKSLHNIYREVRAWRPGVLHLTDFGAGTFGRVVGRLTRTPVLIQVITHHSEHQPRGFPFYVEAVYRALAPLADRVLAISDSVRDFAVGRMGFDPGEVEVLHYPLPEHSFRRPDPQSVRDARASEGIPDGAPVVGCVTRFHAAKGVRHLLDAWPDVRAEVPDARLVLVGQGPREEALRERCRSLGIGDSVTFAGFQREVERYVGFFSVAAVPSLEEGFGLVALEAHALGVPVVASRVGGLPDIVVDGRTGYLVPPARPDAISDRIVRLLGDGELRADFSEAARERSRDFSLDGYVDRLCEVYRDLASECSFTQRT